MPGAGLFRRCLVGDFKSGVRFRVSGLRSDTRQFVAGRRECEGKNVTEASEFRVARPGDEDVFDDHAGGCEDNIGPRNHGAKKSWDEVFEDSSAVIGPCMVFRLVILS